MRIIVAVAIGAFFGFAAMAMLGIEAKQSAYEEGLRDGIKMGKESIREEYEFLAMQRHAEKEELNGNQSS